MSKETKALCANIFSSTFQNKTSLSTLGRMTRLNLRSWALTLMAGGCVGSDAPETPPPAAAQDQPSLGHGPPSSPEGPGYPLCPAADRAQRSWAGCCPVCVAVGRKSPIGHHLCSLVKLECAGPLSNLWRF